MFDRAQSRLVLLKETEEVTARDILDVFRDLCSDVSQEGKKVEKLPPGRRGRAGERPLFYRADDQQDLYGK